MGIEVITEVSCDKCGNRGIHTTGLKSAKKEALESVLSAGWTMTGDLVEPKLYCPDCSGKTDGYWKKGFTGKRGIFLRQDL